MFVLPSASLISRSAFLSVGGFDERLSGYEDDDLFLRMFRAGFDNVYLPQSLSKWRIYQESSSYSSRMAVSRATYARKLIERFPNDEDNSRYYVRDLIAPRFFNGMARELRKAILRDTKEQQSAALANLRFISAHLRLTRRLPVQLVFLPAMRIPPLARFIMRNRAPIAAVLRRVLRSERPRAPL
jgi:GT2 family glycosyltransferase